MNRRRQRVEAERLEGRTLMSADLTVASTNPSTPIFTGQGETVSVAYVVRNVGTTEAADARYDSVFLSSDATLDAGDAVLDAQRTDGTPLAPGASYTVASNINIPSYAAFGSQFLLFVTDDPRFSGRPDGYQPESDETNNVLSLAVTVQRPDLVVSAPSAGPLTVAPGDRRNLNFTVRNQGGGPAINGWYDSISYSEDETLDSGDALIYGQFSGALDPTPIPMRANDQYDVAAAVDIPSTATPGTHYLFFVTNDERYSVAQEESVLSNNASRVTLNVVAPTGLPNLTLTSPSAPAAGLVSGSINLSYAVTNTGTANALAANNDFDAVYLSQDNVLDPAADRRIHTEAVYDGVRRPLNPGESYTATSTVYIPTDVPQGNYFLFFRTDAFQSLVESNEADNGNAAGIPIRLDAPDLRVTQSASPSAAVSGEQVQLQFAVANDGSTATGDAPAQWRDAVVISSDDVYDPNVDVLLTSVSNGPLAKGSSAPAELGINLPTYLAPGSYFLLFVADYQNAQGEVNEDNNVRSAPITLRGPDLTVTDFAAPAQAASDSPITFTWGVRNAGGFTAVGDWYDAVYVSADAAFDPATDQQVASLHSGGDGQTQPDVTPLAAGDSYSRSFDVVIPGSLGGGRKYLFLVADANGNQGETNEANNVSAARAVLMSAPDLIVSAVSAPAQAIAGGPLSISYTVINNSPSLAGADWSDTIYLSADEVLGPEDRQLLSIDASAETPLAGHGSYSRTADVSLPHDVGAGTYYVFLKTDYSQNQAETDEGNNEGRAPGTLTVSAPDLTVASAAAPASAQPGSSFDLTYTVTNVSTTTPALTDHFVYFYLSDDDVLGNGDDVMIGQAYTADPSRFPTGSVPLAPGGSYSSTQPLTVPVNPSPETRFLLVVADGGGNQAETSETNNVFAQPFTTSANLSIDDVTVNESAGSATFTVRLSAAAASPVTVHYAVADGTASVGSDVTAVSGILAFAPGETSRTITVPVINETLFEEPETFFVNLTEPSSNAIVGDGVGVGRINNDDPQPFITINDVEVTEGNSGTAAATFRLTLSNPSSVSITVRYTTGTGTSAAGSDYAGVASPGVLLTIPANATSQTFTVDVIGDMLPEPDETFTVNLSQPTNAGIADSQGVATIVDDEIPVVVQVWVAGGQWSSGFRGYLQAKGLAGGTTLGFAVPAGLEQANELPWVNVDQIVVRFSENVSVQDGDLTVHGVNIGNYPVAAFSYDPTTFTAVWTLTRPLSTDKVLITLDGDGMTGGVIKANQRVMLDGNWLNATPGESYPSGDGIAGGDFAFRLNVLRGDATRDGVVNAQDLAFIKQRLNRTSANPGATGAVYSMFGDLTADGSINAQDLSAAKQRLNNKLPTADPATALLISGKTISR